MRMGKHAVTIKQLPQALTVERGRAFFGEVESRLHTDRPRLVIDCVHLDRMDRHVILLLLCCLEEAMKRNGDVKLAAVPYEARAMLDLTGVSRLFEIYDSTTDAVNSFYKSPLAVPAPAILPRYSQQGSESAA